VAPCRCRRELRTDDEARDAGIKRKTLAKGACKVPSRWRSARAGVQALAKATRLALRRGWPTALVLAAGA